MAGRMTSAARAIGVAICLSVLAAACVSSGGDGAQVPPDGRTGACEGGSPTGPTGDETPIPSDEGVDVTVLDNGLTVYVRENDSPGGRAQMGLVVRAGSVDETEDQSGVAHFLEHMLFNGTERWPDNELLDVLGRFGTQLGPDLNAFTSYDATQYWLEAPDTRAETLGLATDVLAEWASRATLTEEEVANERGVVVEELRLRDESADGRIGDAYDDLILTGTPYEGRAPGGELGAVEAMERGPLVDFYRDWYRPDEMAVVAVGDFDAAEVTELVAERFGELAGGAEERERHTLEPWTSPRYGSLVEAEAATPGADLFFALEPLAGETAAEWREQWLRVLAFDLLTTRLSDDISRGRVPLVEATFSPRSPVTTLALPAVGIEAAPGDLGRGIEAALEEFERACRFGFSPTELTRAVEERRTGVDEQYASRGTTQDRDYAGRYAEHFLNGAAIPDADDTHELDLEILDSITADDVTDWFTEHYAGVGPSIMAVGPDEGDVPSPDELERMAADAREAELESRTEDERDDEDLMERPAPAPILSRDQLDGFDAEVLEFENGVRVVIQPSDIHEGRVDLGGESPGGLWHVDDADVVAAQAVGDVVTQSGVGDLDQVALERILADRDVEVGLDVSDVSESVWGTASVGDAETLLQLVHLYLTEPRVSEPAVEATVSQVLPIAEDPGLDPETAAFSALLGARFGDETRYRFPPDADELRALDVPNLSRVAEDRLTDTGDFAFVLVGDFDPDEVEQLAASYLGTLPAGDPEDRSGDAPGPPVDVVTREVATGSGDQGRLLQLYTLVGPATPDTEVVLDVLTALVSARLLDVIREQLAATYSPDVQADVTHDPEPSLDVLVDVSADPSRLDEVSRVVRDELAAIAAGDYSDDELTQAQASVTSDYELWDNALLIDAHLFHLAHPGADPHAAQKRLARARQVDRAQVTALAAALFTADRHLEVLVRPG